MRRVLLTIALLALSAGALAQLGTDWSGRLETRLGLESTGDLTAAGAEARLALDGEVGSEFFPTAAFRVELRAKTDAATDTADVRLDEAWARVFLNDGVIEATAGNQRHFWGSTDGVNPVDRLNPRDLSVPPDAEKLAVPMLHLRAWLEHDVNLEAVLIPAFVPSIAPGEAWRDEPTFASPPGTTVTEIRPLRDERPEASLQNLQGGVRVQWRPAGFDLAASYLYVYRDVPTRSAEAVPTGAPGEVAVQPVARYDRLHVVGLDGSVALGDVVLRGEIAYLFTDDPSGTDPAVGEPSFHVVIGAETPVPDGPRLVTQVILDGETKPAAPTTETGELDVAVRAMLVATYAANARTDLEVAWVHDLDGSGLVRPGASYTFADGVTGTLAGLVAYGPDASRYGDWRERTGAEVSLRVDF